MKLWRTMLVVGGTGCLGLLVSAGARGADVQPPRAVDDPSVAAPAGAATEPASGLDEYFVEIPLNDRPPTSGRTKPATPPAPTPPPPPDSNPEIDALVKQLGDADFRRREAAVAKLKEMGPAALPALKRAAAEATDPEVVSRASGVVRFLERPRMPGGLPAGSTFADAGFGVPGNVNFRMSIENGTRRVEVREHNGRVVRIDSGPNGINMSVTGEEEGKPVTHHFQARTPEELKRQSPEAFELFEKWTGRREALFRRGGVMRPRVPAFRRALPPGVPNPQLGPDAGMLEMRKLLRRHLDPFAADAAARHPEDVMRMFEPMQRMRAADAEGMLDPMADDIAERMRQDREAIRRDVEALQNRLRAFEEAEDAKE